MSKSTPLKRKHKSTQRIIDSDSDEEFTLQLKESKSIRRSESVVQINEQTEPEDTGIFCLVQFVSKLTDYGIVAEKLISFDLDDPNIGKVKHYSKNYTVKILKKGFKIKIL